MRDEATLLRILWALSAIPTDEAFTALVERRHVKSALPAVLHAMQHYPRRALKILAERDINLLDRHVRANPDIAAELSPTLPSLQGEGSPNCRRRRPRPRIFRPFSSRRHGRTEESARGRGDR